MDSARAWTPSLPSHSVNKMGSQYLPVPTLGLISLLLPTTLQYYLFEPTSTVITPPFMTVQSKTMKDSISEGGNNTEKENELARLNQLNNQLLAQVAALNKEKLTW